MPTATDLAIAFKRAIDRQDAAALTRLAKTYNQLYLRMQDKLDSLILAMSKLDEPTTGQVHRLAQYKSLLNSVEEELKKYAGYVEIEIQTETRAAADLALKQTQTYLAGFGLSMPQRVPTEALMNMLGYLTEGSPMWKRLSLYSAEHTARLADALTEGMAFGYNPTKVAKTFERIMGGGLTDAMRMTRTSMLHAYRDASQRAIHCQSGRGGRLDVVEFKRRVNLSGLLISTRQSVPKYGAVERTLQLSVCCNSSRQDLERARADRRRMV